jgi:hypothetical protein
LQAVAETLLQERASEAVQAAERERYAPLCWLHVMVNRSLDLALE